MATLLVERDADPNSSTASRIGSPLSAAQLLQQQPGKIDNADRARLEAQDQLLCRFLIIGIECRLDHIHRWRHIIRRHSGRGRPGACNRGSQFWRLCDESRRRGTDRRLHPKKNQNPRRQSIRPVPPSRCEDLARASETCTGPPVGSKVILDSSVQTSLDSPGIKGKAQRHDFVNSHR